MLLNTSPMENVVCTCVVGDCDAQRVGRCWVKGTLISDVAAVVRFGLCKPNVVLIWSVSSHGDLPGLAAAATVASSTITACLCSLQRQLKGTCSSSWTSSAWTYWAGLGRYWPTSRRQDVKCSNSVESPARLFLPACLILFFGLVHLNLFSPTFRKN